MTVKERMLARLRAMGEDLPEGVRLDSTRAGRQQRSEGAWSWVAYGKDSKGRWIDLGSHWPMWALLGCKSLSITLDHEGHGADRSRSVDPGSRGEELAALARIAARKRAR